jgi:hypothetical protein
MEMYYIVADLCVRLCVCVFVFSVRVLILIVCFYCV